MEVKIDKPLERLKIAFIAGTLGMGGAERQLYLIVQKMQSLGANVTLICLQKGEYWEEPVKSLGIRYYSLNGKGGKVSTLVRILFILFKVRPQIIQSQHFFTNLYAFVCAKFLFAKSVGASRNELKVEIHKHGLLGKLSFRLPDILIVNSHKSENQAIELGRNKNSIYYLANAIDLTKYSKNIVKTDHINLLAIGRLTHQKRFDKFIELIARLKANYGNLIHATLIGDGILKDDLLQLAINRNIEKEDISIVPYTNEPEFFYKNADIFVLTSDYEGTPNVVLESMASSLPVVMTNVGDLNFFVNDGENGLFFDGTVDDLFLKVVSVIEEKDLQLRLSENARTTIEQIFSLERLELNLVNIYSKLIKKRNN